MSTILYIVTNIINNAYNNITVIFLIYIFIIHNNIHTMALRNFKTRKMFNNNTFTMVSSKFDSMPKKMTKSALQLSPTYKISEQSLRSVFSRLRNRLSSLDSSTSTIEVKTEYASHFYDMYIMIKQHDGKHMTGDRMKILMLNLPFLMLDAGTHCYYTMPFIHPAVGNPAV
jgi:hypothetical protein